MRNVPVPMPWRILLVSVAFQLGAAHAQSLTYLVGADSPNCDFATIQEAINAAQSHPGPDTVRIASNLGYAGLALKVGRQDLTIEGGYATCASPAPTSPHSRTTLSGAGPVGDSVIEFDRDGVRVLRGLSIVSGDDPTSGGGIQFSGHGRLYLENVTILNNTSAFGGGINFHGRGAGVGYLELGPDVVVADNIATESGGGIRVTGIAQLVMEADGTAVIGNEARGSSSDQVGHGGGILIVGPAHARIASPGFADAAIEGNFAKYGGGLAVLAPDEESVVALYSVDRARPLRILGNRASIQGGGLYIGGNDGWNLSHACVDAHEIQVEANRAPVGAAAYLNEVAEFSLNPDPHAHFHRCGYTISPPATAVSCATDASPACSRISGNRSEDGAGHATTGAVVAVREDAGAHARLERVALTGNSGGALLHRTSCDGCLLARNDVVVALAVFPHEPYTLVPYQITGSTIADNIIDGPDVFRVGHPLLLKDSIIEQRGKRVFLLDGGDADVDAENLLVHSCSAINCLLFPNVIAAATGPRFVDSERGNYRLQAASQAVDFAPSVEGDDRDLDGNLRDIELDPVRNRLGTRDLGAYERQDLEPLVLNGDFVGDIHPWRVGALATAAVVDGGVQGNPGGMALISDNSDRSGDLVIGLRQCVPLPIPGEYRLTGFAAGQGFADWSRDRVQLRWRYYAQTTSNTCTGIPTRSGEVLFPNRRTLSPPLQDGIIAVAIGEFTERSQVEIELVAIEGNPVAVNDPTGGMFDGIRLLPPTDPRP